MKTSDLKQLMIKFGKTLNDKDKDEWWGTDKDFWDDMGKRFLMWYNNYGQKEYAKMQAKTK